ncbi:MAG TPA: hypothetical protein VNW15_10560 [Rhizomicrobium sp.]|nr:hypothetical protein [Rhizomicrobium sp.]
MKHAICMAAGVAFFLLGGPIAVEAAILMDTSGGVALPSPAISFVPGYPRPSDVPQSVTRKNGKSRDTGVGRSPAHIASGMMNPVSPD